MPLTSEEKAAIIAAVTAAVDGTPNAPAASPSEAAPGFGSFRRVTASAPSERCAKKRDDRKWRIGFDDHRGKRVHEEGDNRKKSVFDEIVLGDWLHIEMMNEKDDCYWMRLGVGKDERVFFSYVKNGKRVIRQDEGPGHE